MVNEVNELFKNKSDDEIEKILMDKFINEPTENLKQYFDFFVLYEKLQYSYDIYINELLKRNDITD